MRVNLEIPITRPAQAAGFFVGRTPDLAVKMAPLNMDGMSGFHRMGTRLSLAVALGIGVALTGCSYGSRTEAEIACNKWAEKGRRFQHKAILQLARTLVQTRGGRQQRSVLQNGTKDQTGLGLGRIYSQGVGSRLSRQRHAWLGRTRDQTVPLAQSLAAKTLG